MVIGKDGGSMVISEQEQRPVVEVLTSIEEHGSEAQFAERSVRILLTIGFLIVLAIEGWLLAKVLLA